MILLVHCCAMAVFSDTESSEDRRFVSGLLEFDVFVLFENCELSEGCSLNFTSALLVSLWLV